MGPGLKSGGALRPGSGKSDCGNLLEIAGKLQKNYGAVTKPPEASRSNTAAQVTHRTIPVATPPPLPCSEDKLNLVPGNAEGTPVGIPVCYCSTRNVGFLGHDV